MENRTRFFRIVVSMLLIGGVAIGTWASKPERAMAQAGDPVLVGAGDIVECGSQGAESTAELIDQIPGTVFTLGDNVYPNGSITKYQSCYDQTWGRFKNRTMPVIGNHDFARRGQGYYGYFGSAAAPLDPGCTTDCRGYYSYNLGAWHIIVLNSETQVKAGSEQEQWLKADLAANISSCTLAMWHEPLFSSGRHGNNPRVAAFWDDLYQYGADVVLNGHDHTYERFAPQNPQGQADPNGIREFVVGTGGAELYEFNGTKPNSEVRDNSTHGVLKLTLHANGYDWQFVPVAGGTFSDSGSANCTGGQSIGEAVGTAMAAVPTLAGTVIAPATPQTQRMTPEIPSTGDHPSAWTRFVAWLRHLFGLR